MKLIEDSASLKATKGFAKILAVVIVLSVAAFGDVMYIQEMGKIFAKDPSLLLFCYLGAFTSFLAIGYILLGKSAVFSPGPQMLAAWIAFAAELLIIALNIMLVFSPHATGFMQAWSFISPATPVMHMVLVALIFFLDPELKEKHRDMEMQSKLRDLNRKHQFSIAEAGMTVKQKQLDHAIREMDTAVNSPETLQEISRHAQSMNSMLLTEMSGRSVPKDDRDDSSSNDRYYGRR